MRIGPSARESRRCAGRRQRVRCQDNTDRRIASVHDPKFPIRAMLTFTPGLAPAEEPEFRDEEVVHMRASERLREIQANDKT